MAIEEIIEIVIDVNDKNVSSPIKRISKDLQKLKKSVDSFGKSLTAMGKSLTVTSQKMKILSLRVTASAMSMEKATVSAIRMGTAINGIGNIGAVLSSMSSSVKDFSAVTLGATTSVSNFSKKIIDASLKLRAMKSGSDKSVASITRLQMIIQRIKGTINSASASLTLLGSRLKSAAIKARALSSSISHAGMSIKEATELSTKLALGIGLIGAVSATRFATFEQVMNRVEGTLQGTASEMKELSDLAREMGRTTVFTAQQSADAMIKLAQAGFDTKQVMSALSDTLNLAAIGQMEMSEAASLASNILKGMRLETKDLKKVIDVLGKASTKMNITIKEMGVGFSKAGNLAATTNISMEELAVSIGFIKETGESAEIAGTALRNIIQRLGVQANKSGSKVKELGINVLDASGKLLPMNKIVDEFNSKLSNLSQTAKQTELTKIFEQRGAVKFLALMQRGGDEMRKLTVEISKSEGFAKKFMETLLKGLSGALIKMVSALDGMAISIGQKLAPTIVFISDKIISMTKAWDKLDSNIQNGILVVAGAVAVYGLFAAGLASAGLTVVAMTTAVSALAPVVTALAVALAPVVAAAIGLAAPFLLAAGIIVLFWQAVKAASIINSSFADSIGIIADFISKQLIKSIKLGLKAIKKLVKGVTLAYFLLKNPGNLFSGIGKAFLKAEKLADKATKGIRTSLEELEKDNPLVNAIEEGNKKLQKLTVSLSNTAFDFANSMESIENDMLSGLGIQIQSKLGSAWDFYIKKAKSSLSTVLGLVGKSAKDILGKLGIGGEKEDKKPLEQKSSGSTGISAVGGVFEMFAKGTSAAQGFVTNGINLVNSSLEKMRLKQKQIAEENLANLSLMTEAWFGFSASATLMMDGLQLATQSIFQNLVSGITEMVNNTLFEGERLLEGLKKLGISIAKSLIAILIKMALTAVAQNLIMGKSDQAKSRASIQGKAAEAGAGGTASMAAAPFPINLGAAGFGAAMYSVALGFMSLVGLKDGGIVTGPTNALIGEGNEAEAVIPLSRLEGMIGNKTQNITLEIDGQTFAQTMVRDFPEELRWMTGTFN